MYSLDFKRQVVEESMLSGASVSIVARRHDLSTNQVFAWRKQYQEGSLRSSRHPLKGAVAGEPSGFVAVGSYQPASRTHKAEIELPNRIKLSIPTDIGEACLRRILAIVVGLSC
jgi:transposase